MCRDAGVRIEYLPPYSPDMNPIEVSFAVLKSWIRAHQETAQLYEEHKELGGFGEFLKWAVDQQQCRGDAIGLFRKSGYVV